MQYCPTCSKPIWGSWPLSGATIPPFNFAYCQCALNGTALTINVDTSGLTTTPPSVGYGEITAPSPYYGFAQETTAGTPICPSNFSKWLDGSMTDEDCELARYEAKKTEVPQAFYDAFADEDNTHG